jgi:Glycosyl transferase family 11
MSKKIVYLMGGLGNVLFQINYLYNLREQGFLVKADCTLLRDNFFTNKILRWSNHKTLDILADLELLDDIDINFDGYKNIFVGALAKFTGRVLLSTQYSGLVAPEMSDKDPSHLFGYFHERNPINKLLVKKINNRIKKLVASEEFSILSEALQAVGDNYVVHVRGGDYKQDSAFVISKEYYRKALMGQKKCFIVTNDKEFSRRFFEDIEIDYDFLNTRTSLEDFIILALCRNKVLANSTFSWWAAEIGPPECSIYQRNPFYNHVHWQPLSDRRRNTVEI